MLSGEDGPFWVENLQTGNYQLAAGDHSQSAQITGAAEQVNTETAIGDDL